MPLKIPTEYVDARTTGIHWPGEPVSFTEFAAARHSLHDGPFTPPFMVLRRAAVRANIAALADFCARRGVLLAPHGKTTMAPALFRQQLEAGAWGMTAATPSQVRAYRSFGVERILLANELVDRRLAAWIASKPCTFVCLVDSRAGVDLLAGTGIQVLIDVGYPGGRTGVRSVEEAASLASYAAGRVRVAGISGYEGGIADAEEVICYLKTLREAAQAVAPYAEDEFIISAGGSIWFDLVADHLAGEAQLIIRSGAYVSHDHGYYQRLTPFQRLTAHGPIHAALELWAPVLSVPEPGVAYALMGKREAPYDIDLPVSLDHPGLKVRAVNDHHAQLDVPSGITLTPGDLLRFGVSHPCTAFDKWRTLLVADEDDAVVDLIRTYF
ncbi:alanine racemase [Nonomuraea sp. NPDC050536]|uniref:alanine racemase n=1 Tax=Nonomuraea sp. NPDC050536 TaxID=3364366 RepID=UPI0037C5EB55